MYVLSFPLIRLVHKDLDISDVRSRFSLFVHGDPLVQSMKERLNTASSRPLPLFATESLLWLLGRGSSLFSMGDESGEARIAGFHGPLFGAAQLYSPCGRGAARRGCHWRFGGEPLRNRLRWQIPERHSLPARF